MKAYNYSILNCFIELNQIMCSCEKPTAECVQARNLGDGIEQAVMMKNVSRLISDEISTNNVKNLWPPIPQDTLNDNSI